MGTIQTFVSKVSRGMVVSLDSCPYEEVDKERLTVEYNGENKKTFLICGERPHIVIYVHKHSKIAHVIPLRTTKPYGKCPTINLGINGKLSYMDIANMTAVDSFKIEAGDYMGMINEDTCKEIDKEIVRFLAPDVLGLEPVVEEDEEDVKPFKKPVKRRRQQRRSNKTNTKS